MISVKEQIKYWYESSQDDCETMEVLFKGGRYSDSLFFGHIVLEKILKALVVSETGKEPPKIHNLIRLTELANLKLDQTDKDYLSVVNDFNIRARYDDYKKAFYKICTKEYAAENLKKIAAIYKKLCQALKQKKS